MQAHVAIEARGLGKRYRIRTGAPIGSRMLRDDLSHLLGRALRRDGGHGESRDVWAVRDLDFDVERGEVFGLLGHNGAGKSTLLRLLSRITPPTVGSARIRGRVGTLLDIGTGFHLELTGRENVYLHAAVLGMRRADVARRLPEIVEMAGIGDYLDVPVKRYSTGMFVRLAFAVAAHLEPDVLLVDELLAAGDAEFRSHCLATIERVRRAGATVVFVSHDVTTLQRICTRAAYLRRGALDFLGPAAEAVARYMTDRAAAATSLDARQDRDGSGAARITAIELHDEDARPLDAVSAGKTLDLRFRYACPAELPSGDAKLTLLVRTAQGHPVFTHDNTLSGQHLGALAASGTLCCRLSKLPLPAGIYRLSFRLSVGGELVDALSDALELRVGDGPFYETGLMPDACDAVCLVDASFRSEP